MEVRRPPGPLLLRDHDVVEQDIVAHGCLRPRARSNLPGGPCITFGALAVEEVFQGNAHFMPLAVRRVCGVLAERGVRAVLLVLAAAESEADPPGGGALVLGRCHFYVEREGVVDGNVGAGVFRVPAEPIPASTLPAWPLAVQLEARAPVRSFTG